MSTSPTMLDSSTPSNSRPSTSVRIRNHDQVLAELDERIQSVRNELISLQRKRNSYAPISILPEEILTKIFKTVELMQIDGAPYWISVTEVCQQWRDICLDHAPLWTRIDNKHHYKLEHIDLFLVRSKNLPLTVVFDFENEHGRRNRDHNIRCLKATLSQLAHIRNLSLAGYAHEDWPLIQAFLSLPAPHLVTFNLTISRILKPIYDTDVSSTGDSLFQGQAPMLQSFSYRAHLLPWRISALRLTGLTELILRPVDIHYYMPLESMWVEVCLVLKENPRLQVLDISGMWANIGLVSMPASRIALPCLKELHIEDMAGYVVSSFLKIVEFPKDINWSIACDSDPLSEDYVIITSIMNDRTPCNSLHLILERNGLHIKSEGGEFNNLTRTLRYKWNLHANSLNFVFTNTIFIIQNRFWQSATDLTLIFSVGTRESSNSSLVGKLAYLTFLSSLSQLRTLKVAFHENLQHTFDVFLDALSESKIHDNSKTFLCPQLSELTFSPINGNIDSSNVEKLLRLLKSRDECGMRIHTLDIRDHHGASQETEDLLMASGCIDKVLWKRS